MAPNSSRLPSTGLGAPGCSSPVRVNATTPASASKKPSNCTRRTRSPSRAKAITETIRGKVAVTMPACPALV